LPAGSTHADAPEHPCTWFTTAEISERLGTGVRAGKVAGPLGTACRWEGETDSAAFVLIEVVRDVSFWSVPKDPSVTVLPGVGRAAYVQWMESGIQPSWVAAGLLDKAFVSVYVGGANVTRAVAERLLVDTLSRVR
jgi:hypothetical protein